MQEYIKLKKKELCNFIEYCFSETGQFDIF